MSIEIEKLHDGYRLVAYPYRSLALTAQDLRDIYNWCLLHMRELEAAATVRNVNELVSDGPRPEHAVLPQAKEKGP